MRQSRFTGEWTQGGNRNVFHTYNPEGYWYAQDRWEYEGMVVNYGLRWELQKLYGNEGKPANAETKYSPAECTGTEIVEIQVALLEELLASRRISVRLTPSAKAELARRGYDPAYGARPLKRVIQREIQNALAMKLLEGEIREGARVVVDGGEEGFTFSPDLVTGATESADG